MAVLLRSTPHIRDGLKHWLDHDPRFAASGLTIQDVTAQKDPTLSLAALAETICGQQLSTKAAATIWGRVKDHIDVTDPKAYLDLSLETWRSLGLSRAKADYVAGLASMVADDQIDLAGLARAPNDVVIRELTRIKGLGVWSAQMILIFTLARPDVWPAGDLGIQDGVRIYRRLAERPDAKATEAYGQRRFKPHLTAAALLLWRLKDRTSG